MNMPAQFLNQIGLNPNQGKRKKLTFMKNSHKALPRWVPRLLPPTVTLFTALALAACSTQPAYQPPRLDVPARFKEATPEAAQFGIWQPAQSSAASPAAAVPDQWWTVYGDSTLDQLQQAAAAGNPSVEQADARLRSAQAALARSRAAPLPTL
ncbi:MAG: RND transporter, partial [Comamonas sp.]|nr:RND transporter [Comamonas sp.]